MPAADLFYPGICKCDKKKRFGRVWSLIIPFAFLSAVEAASGVSQRVVV